MTSEISAVITVSERFDPVRPLYAAYKAAFEALPGDVQVIYVLDGEFPDVLADLEKLIHEGEVITIVELSKWYGEATALTLALPSVTGDIVLTLPAYRQVVPDDLGALVAALDQHDVALAVRHPRMDSSWNRFQSKVFHGVMNWVSGSRYRDLGCGVRAFRKTVFDEVPVYGDLHRFLPMLASRAGFSVTEVEIPQAEEDYGRRVYHPGVYVRRILDMITVFFLVKFTKKPLRFFGLIGGSFAGVGGLVIFWLLFERVFMDTALGGRPALMLGALFFALGIQVIAVGLIGELIIFTHALSVKEYKIDKIVTKETLGAPANSD